MNLVLFSHDSAHITPTSSVLRPLKHRVMTQSHARLEVPGTHRYVFNRCSDAFSFICAPLLVCATLLTALNANAEEHLTLLDDSQVVIDGDVSEWISTRHSAEHLVRGSVADMSDFNGGLRVAFSERWIYLALDGEDDLIQSSRKADRVEIHFADARRRRHQVFTLSLGDLSRDRSPKLRRGRSALSQAEVQAQFSPKEEGGGRYAVELKIPMTTLPWVYGAPVRLTAIFYDYDTQQDSSVYATHLTNRRGITDTITYSFGGADVFKSMYPLRGGEVIAELNHDWSGDERDELLIVTTAEVVLFGHQIRRGRGYTRLVHGLPLSSQSAIKVSGSKPRKRITITYQEDTAQGPKAREATYVLRRGRLKRVKSRKPKRILQSTER